MVSIIASPTKRVRDTVPAESGCRAIASIAEATARPSPSAGATAPNDTAIAAAKMLTSWIVLSMMFLLSAGGGGRFLPLLGDCRADEDHCKHGEDVGLDGSGHDIEGHEGNRHEKAGQRQHDRANKDAAHDIAEEANDQRKDAGDLLDDVERDHDPCRLSKSAEVAGQSSRPHPVKDRRAKDDRPKGGIGL